MNKVLIAGGSGLIGSSLAGSLVDNGYVVGILSRSKNASSPYRNYIWDPAIGKIDDSAIREADIIINLAGAGIGDQRWSENRKNVIQASRIQSTRLLVDTIIRMNHQPQLFVQGSAIGYYGDNGSRWLTEEDASGNDFLAKVCVEWEAEARRLSQYQIPLFIVRTGVVLSRHGGALPKLDRTSGLGFLNYLGDGRQYYSWIHEDDMTGIIKFAIDKKLEGVFNAVSPAPVSNKAFIQILAELRKTSLVLPAPSFVIQLALGEMAIIVLASQRCSSEKIEKAGYQFLFPDLRDALMELYFVTN